MLNHTDLDGQLNAYLAAPYWYVGYSGGVDSTVLLHLLHRWCAAHSESPPLGAIHINHALQSAAGDWQRHCATVCAALGLPFTARTVEVQAGGSREAAARAARYRAFEEHLPAGAVLFLGHHLDDQVETFFLRLLRGAGVEGLAGMPRTRPLGAAQLARPLLDVSRSEIEHYAAHHGLEYVEDPSNANTAMDRNFLRAQALPLLATRWPAYRHSVARAIGHLTDMAAAMARELGDTETTYSVLGDPGLALAQLGNSPEAIAATRLRAWLRTMGCQAPDLATLVEFLRQLREADVDTSPVLACGAYSLQRYREAIYLLPDFSAPPPEVELEVAPGSRNDVPGVGAVSLRASVDDGLWLAPGETLTLRWRRGGERCRLPGRAGSRALKTLLQDWGVPPWWRDRVPLFYVDEELLAIGDLARCESYRWRECAQAGEHLWQVSWERPFRAGSD